MSEDPRPSSAPPDAAEQEPLAEDEASDDRPTIDEVKPKPVPLEVWYARMQLLAGEYPQGQTQAMNDFRRIQFGRAVAEKFDGSLISFHAKVRDVRWQDGVADILTESEFPESRRVGRVKVSSGGGTLRLRRNAALEVVMDQEAAAAILPESLGGFEGRLDYHSRLGSSGRPQDGQRLYSVEHAELGGAIGVFTSSNFVCTIGGKTYSGRWNNDTPEN